MTSQPPTIKRLLSAPSHGQLCGLTASLTVLLTDSQNIYSPTGGAATDCACATIHPPPVSSHVVPVTALLQFAFPILWRIMYSYYHHVCHYVHVYHINFKTNTRFYLLTLIRRLLSGKCWARISKEHRLSWGFSWFFLVSSDRDGKLPNHCALIILAFDVI
jgi:hypothetical protein